MKKEAATTVKGFGWFPSKSLTADRNGLSSVTVSRLIPLSKTA